MSVIERLESIVAAPTSTEESRTEPEIEIHSALSLLANERRRLTIRYAIEEADGMFDLNDVVRHITIHEYGSDYTSSERKRVYISLYQAHMGELVEAGVLERVDDGEAHTFCLDDSARPLYDILEATTARLGGEE